ncbi:MAG TPA: lysophospholipid acyltransferase family protein [Actinomycetota bacterium]
MGARDELRAMASGFRWGRRPLVPRSAEPHTEPKDDAVFPSDWARSEAGVAARQALLKGVMHPLVRNELTLRVFGRDNLEGVDPPLILFSNHSSHLDATLIMCTLPDRWQAKTAVGAARDYFFDVWWRQAFTALVYGAFPIDRSRGGRGAVDKARELLSEGWSIVVFPEGTRSPDGHLQRFRHGAARLALETGAGLAPIAIVGAYQAMPKGRMWPRSGRPPVTLRYGVPFRPQEGETHQSLSRRMTAAVNELFHEERTTWWEAIRRAQRGETPSLVGPAGPTWLRRWEGSRPVPRKGPDRVWD